MAFRPHPSLEKALANVGWMGLDGIALQCLAFSSGALWCQKVLDGVLKNFGTDWHFDRRPKMQQQQTLRLASSGEAKEVSTRDTVELPS